LHSRSFSDRAISGVGIADDKGWIFKQQAAHIVCAFVLNDEEALFP
jgi:hypothetical protein